MKSEELMFAPVIGKFPVYVLCKVLRRVNDVIFGTGWSGKLC
jgi:hypothetical protein